MGALRAAELYPYGMEGYGWIFENYKSGRITGDDEVALSYSPLDQAPLTIPLVNARRWLEQLQAGGALDRRTAGRLLRQARGIFFADRTFLRLREAFRSIVDDAVLERIMRSEEDITDIKAADARLVLSYVASSSGNAPTPKGEQTHGNKENHTVKDN
jgi:hypothetical protein